MTWLVKRRFNFIDYYGFGATLLVLEAHGLLWALASAVTVGVISGAAQAWWSR